MIKYQNVANYNRGDNLWLLITLMSGRLRVNYQLISCHYGYFHSDHSHQINRSAAPG